MHHLTRKSWATDDEKQMRLSAPAWRGPFSGTLAALWVNWGRARSWLIRSDRVACTTVAHAHPAACPRPDNASTGAGGMGSFTGSQGHILKPRNPPELRIGKDEMLQT